MIRQSQGSIWKAGSAALLLWLVPASEAEGQSVDRGRRLAILHCARCHSVDRYTPSPFRAAPPFRTLKGLYSLDTLEEALAEGIVTGNPNMPEFRFEPDQVADFIAFLNALAP